MGMNHMNSEMFAKSGVFGEYLRVKKTGEIVEWASRDDKKLTVEIVSLTTRVVSTVRLWEIEVLTANECCDAERSLKKRAMEGGVGNMPSGP